MTSPTPPLAPRPEAETPTQDTSMEWLRLTLEIPTCWKVVAEGMQAFARQLERQRDQARVERDDAKSKLIAFDNLLKASDGLIATNGAPKALRDALAERDALRQALEDLNRVTRQLLIAGTLPKAQDDAWAEYGHAIYPAVCRALATPPTCAPQS